MTQAWRTFVDVLPVLVVAVCLAAPVAVLRARQRVRRLGESWRSATATVALHTAAVLVLVALLGITLDPIGVGLPASANWVPFTTIIDQVTSQVDTSVAFRNLGGNVLLFVPVGFLWAWAAVRSGRSWGTALTAAAAISVGVELVQLVVPLGRAVDVDDVLLNVLGALLGALVFRVFPRRMPQPDTEGVASSMLGRPGVRQQA
jgi:glycopeptide antibiotics resistance protein